MATSSVVTSAHTETGTWAPPRKARDRPAPVTCRATTSSSSSRSPPASCTRSVTRVAVGPGPRLSRPSTTARSAPTRTARGSARSPSSRPSPVTIMVLPAPVSPVTTVSPGCGATTASLMTPRSRMRSSSITASPPARRRAHLVGVLRVVAGTERHPVLVVHPVLGLAAPAPPARADLVHEPVCERGLGEPGQQQPVLAPLHLDLEPGAQVGGTPPVTPDDPVGLGPLDE